ncbi:MAG: glycosyltransferase [Bacteroidaceae bacterium]|nr:glycosyltransferase [Bacteroidaceae bacterium]MBR7052247.1 glycosyltransferase [Bacteroidaceae bacterium]
MYKVENTLDRCVESVASQAFDRTEIILVDDGSPDSCPALCDQWAERDPRIKVIHKKNGGLSSARNAGLNIATGEWVTFVDSDDWLEPDTYAAVFEKLACSNAAEVDMVEFPVEYDGQSIKDPMEPGCYPVKGRAGRYWLEHRQWLHCAVWNKVFCSTLFDGLRFPEGENHEDIYLLPQLMLKMRAVLTLKDGLYHYMPNSGGICRTPSVESLQLAMNNHLRTARLLKITLSDAWYMTLLNMQISMWRCGGRQVILSSRCLNPLAVGGWRNAVKALLQNVVGVKMLCRLWA